MKQRFLPCLAIAASLSSAVAQSPFPLPIPTRPTSFPLPLPQRPIHAGDFVAWGDLPPPPANLQDVASICQQGYYDITFLLTDGSVVVVPVSSTPFPGASPTTIPAGLIDVVDLAGGSFPWILYANGALDKANPPPPSGGDPSLTRLYESSIVAIAASRTYGSFCLALRNDGTLLSIEEYMGESGGLYPPADLQNVVAVDMGYEHAVALKSDGTLVVWGRQRGEDVPAGLSDVVAVSTADYHTLALKADGTVVAWGANWNGQLNLPSELSDVVAVSAGELVNLALKKDGTIVQWGSTAYAKPVPYGLGSVVAIAASTQSAITVQENASARYALQAIGADIDKLTGLIAERVLAALPDNYGIATKADLGTAVSDATSQAIAQVQATPNNYNLFSAAQYDGNRANGQTDVVSRPNTFGLFDSTQYEANRITGVAEGKAQVTGNPTAYSLFTESSIMDMNLGSLMLKKGEDADALDLELTIETRDNLATNGWQVAERITRSISMDGVQRQFLRVRADAPYVAPDVKVLVHPTLGNILTDGSGRVLYYFAADTPGGNPLFSGSSWPYVTVPAAPKADAGISAALGSSTFGRSGGPYLTVNARPAYFYVGDTVAGQANGQGVGSVWWTVKADGTINQ